MPRRRALHSVVLLAALALAGVATAATTDPQFAVDPADQSWAHAVVLTRADLGTGWRQTPPATETQEEETGSDQSTAFCPEAISDQSDLVVTGGESSDFTRGPSSVTSFATIWRTPENAQASFDRTVAVMPALQACTAKILTASFSGIRMTVTENRTLPFPALAPHLAAYRLKVVIKSTGRSKKKPKPLVVNYDTILLGNGRATVWLMVTSFSDRPISMVKERSLARALAARVELDPTS
jgi:hypothetical protein